MIFERSNILLLFLLSILLVGCKTTAPSLTKYVGGIQINEADQSVWGETLTDAGMNLAQVTAYAKQGSWDTDKLWYNDEDTVHVINEIRALKSKGVSVIMVLRVALQHIYPGNPHKWHGMIYPETRAQKEEWFYRYKHWVRTWSQICEREGVEILAIGSELNSLVATTPIDSLTCDLAYFSDRERQEQHEFKILKYQDQLRGKNIWEYGRPIDTNQRFYIEQKIQSNLDWTKKTCYLNEPNAIELINEDRRYLDSTWRDIIRNTRKHYSGKVTLAANFDNYQEVNFWDELDYLGVNAYFSLRNISNQELSDEELRTELVQGWQKVFNEIDTFKLKENIQDLPLFFTEIGYSKKENCTTTPWKGYGYSLVENHERDTLIIWHEAKQRPQERILAMDALYEVTQKNNIPLEGFSYWKLSSHAYHEKNEAFMLHVSKDATDPLQQSIIQFLVRKKFPDD